MRDYKLYLDDILEAAKRIEKYVKGFSLENKLPRFEETDRARLKRC